MSVRKKLPSGSILLSETIYQIYSKRHMIMTMDKLHDIPTVTVNGELNVKLFTWVSNSAYWFSHSEQQNRLPCIGGIHALIRHVEIIPKLLYLLPEMFIQAAVERPFQPRQTPVFCQYLKIRDPNPHVFPHMAYHGTSIGCYSINTHGWIRHAKHSRL